MRPYSEAPCLKCGCLGPELIYEAAFHSSVGVVAEHLEARCLKCGYRWAMLTKDAMDARLKHFVETLMDDQEHKP